MTSRELLMQQINGVKAALTERRTADALKLCQEALEDTRHSAQLWVFLGESLEQAGRSTQAWRAYERGWILDPAASWVEPVKARVQPLQDPEPEPWLADLLSVPKVTITAAIIAKDEAENVGRTIQSLRHAVDDIVVVDTGSQDATVAIAEENRARVYHFPWQNDFSAARNFALEKVTTDWVLFVDADEALLPEDVKMPRVVAGIYSTIDEPLILRVVVLNDAGGITHPNYDVSRMFAKKWGLRWWGRIHEQIGPPTGDPMTTVYNRPVARIRFMHNGYHPDVMNRKGKLVRNIALLEQAVTDNPSDVASWGFLGRELCMAGRTEEGVEALLRAEELAKDVPQYARLPEVMAVLVEGLTTLNRKEEAVHAATRATTAFPNFPGAWFASGKARMDYAITLIRESQAAFQKAIDTAPMYRGVVSYDEAIANWRSEVGIADAKKLLGDWVQATQLYAKNAPRSANPDAIQRQMDNIQRQASQLVQMVNRNH